MPAFIKTPKDEARWKKAKEAANKTLSESDGDSYWALTNSIYQKMKKSEDLETLQSILEKAKKKLSDEYDPDEDEGDNDLEGLSEFNPDDAEGDAADQWLKEQEKKGKKNEATTDDEGADVGPSDDVGSQKEAGTKESGKAPSQEKIKELDPERLKALKAVAPHWLSHVDQVKKQTADARTNPHLFAEGHRQAAHNAAHEDFNSAYHKFINGEDYKKMSPTQKMRAEIKFKKEFQEKNPDYHKKAAEAVSQAHGMHDKAKELHNKEINARKAHILSGGQAGGETMSSAEAAQHVGGSKNEEGGYSASTIKDPAASFAGKYQQHLAGEVKPQTTEAEEYETLENPEKKVIKHPALEDPKNKKLIEDFFKEHHPLILKAANRARSQAIANGVPEDKIDMSGLHEAGMHGLMQAVHDYSPEVGSSFKAHAGGKMQGLMQSHLAGQDYIPRDMRSKMKAKEKGILSSAPQSEAVSSQAPAAPAKPKVHDVIAGSGHPMAADMADRLKRADAHRAVVIRKPKGQ